jgi:hypothetical protein
VNDTTLHAIVYIACRLISGRRVASLFDILRSREVDMEGILGTGILREFDERHRDYVPGYADECRYTVTSENGTSIELFINERTFIVHIAGTPAYFIGNIQRDSVYLYDHKNSMHFRYRIIRCIEERAGSMQGKELSK